jgi:drug/metabolite transporter (DMT)-like permease
MLAAGASYAISAGIGISDKYFLSRRIPNALSYAFWVGVLGLIYIAAMPLGFYIPDAKVLAAACASGILFTVSLIARFGAVKQDEVSRVYPAIDALVPVFIFFLSILFLNERLNAAEIAAFAILVASSCVLSFSGRLPNDRPRFRTYAGIAATAALAALSGALAKYVYSNHPFVSGFIWMRLAGGVAALAMLAVPSWRNSILNAPKGPRQSLPLLVGIRASAGLSFLLWNAAVALGSVTLVSAMQGLTNAIMFAAIAWFSRFKPAIIKENLNIKTACIKSAAIAGIVAGLAILAVK